MLLLRFFPLQGGKLFASCSSQLCMKQRMHRDYMLRSYRHDFGCSLREIQGCAPLSDSRLPLNKNKEHFWIITCSSSGFGGFSFDLYILLFIRPRQRLQIIPNVQKANQHEGLDQKNLFPKKLTVIFFILSKKVVSTIMGLSHFFTSCLSGFFLWYSPNSRQSKVKKFSKLQGFSSRIRIFP